MCVRTCVLRVTGYIILRTKAYWLLTGVKRQTGITLIGSMCPRGQFCGAEAPKATMTGLWELSEAFGLFCLITQHLENELLGAARDSSWDETNSMVMTRTSQR